MSRITSHSGRFATLLASGVLAAAGLAVASPHASAGTLTPLAPVGSSLVSSTGATLTAAQAVQLVRADQLAGTPASAGRGTTTDQPADTTSIIGTDDRFRVTATTTYPYRANILIERSNGALHCTGFFVSKDTLLTAGHCVHSGGATGTWYSGLRFKPASDGGTAPYGTCASRGTWAFSSWVSSADSNYDIGIVKLNCTAGSSTGWYGTWWQSASLDGTFTRVSGYPGDKPKTQWMSYGTVANTQADRIFYANDTVGGMSGSPVWQFRGSTAPYCANGPCVMAVHTNGLGSLSSTHNSGTRLTQSKLNSIVAIINTP